MMNFVQVLCIYEENIKSNTRYLKMDNNKIDLHSWNFLNCDTNKHVVEVLGVWIPSGKYEKHLSVVR